MTLVWILGIANLFLKLSILSDCDILMLRFKPTFSLVHVWYTDLPGFLVNNNNNDDAYTG